ncbi:hypothetical protein [Cellulomonas sp. P5_E12]|jgi:hypothetical protein
MVVFLIRALIFLGSAALGLWIASLIVDDFSVSAEGFLVAVVVFAALQSILTPWFVVMTRKYANALTGAVGLVSTVVSLWIATLINNSITIKTGTAWVFGSLTVWLVTMLATLVLPLIFLRNRIDKNRAATA